MSFMPFASSDARRCHQTITSDEIVAALQSVFEAMLGSDRAARDARAALSPGRNGRQPPFVIYKRDALPLRAVLAQLHGASGVALAELNAHADSLFAAHGFIVGTFASAKAFVRRHRPWGSLTAQAWFRLAALKLYGGRCAITGCDIAQALDASLIDPNGDPVRENGILLRSDVARLFAVGDIQIDPDSGAVGVAEWACASYPYWRVIAQIPDIVRDAGHLRRRQDYLWPPSDNPRV